MGFFRRLLGAVAFSVGAALLSFGLGAAIGLFKYTGLAQLGKIAALAAALGGINATIAELSTPDQQEPTITDSAILTNSDAQYIYGTDRVGGVLTDAKEHRTGIGGIHGPDGRQKSLDYLYTVANHPCKFMSSFYFSEEKFTVESPISNSRNPQPVTGRVRFTLVRRDDMSDREYNRLNREYRKYLKVWVHFTGDTTQTVTDQIGDETITYATPAARPYREPITDIDVKGAVGFNASWILIQVGRNLKFWNGVQGFHSRRATFTVRGLAHNAAEAIRDYYGRFLNIPASRFNTENYNEAFEFCRLNYRDVNLSFKSTSTEKEQSLRAMIFRCLDGRVVFYKGEYYIKPSYASTPVTTIRAEHLLGDVDHQYRAELSVYGNTFTGSIRDRRDNFIDKSLGKVVHEGALAADGHEIIRDLRSMRGVKTVQQGRRLLKRLVNALVVFGQGDVPIFMTNPPVKWDRVNVDLPEKRMTGIYRVTERTDFLNGSCFVSLVNDPDEIYIDDEVGTTEPGPSRLPAELPKPPSGIAFSEEPEIVDDRVVVDVTGKITKDIRATSTFVELFFKNILFNAYRVDDDSIVINDAIRGSSLKVRAYGMIGDRIGEDYKDFNWTVGSTIPQISPDALRIPDLFHNEDTGTTIIRSRTGKNTRTVEIYYKAGEGAVTESNLSSATLLDSILVRENSNINISITIPEFVEGYVRVILRPISAFGIVGPVTSTLIDLSRDTLLSCFEEAPDWNGDISDSGNFQGTTTPDFIPVEGCLLINSRKPANLILGSEWRTFAEDVLFAARKNTGTAIYTSPIYNIPERWQDQGYAINIYADIIHLRTKERLNTGWTAYVDQYPDDLPALPNLFRRIDFNPDHALHVTAVGNSPSSAEEGQGTVSPNRPPGDRPPVVGTRLSRVSFSLHLPLDLGAYMVCSFKMTIQHYPAE